MAKKGYEINHYLKQQRRLAQITQEDLGRKLGYSSGQFVSNWENNRENARPPHKILKKLIVMLKLNKTHLKKLMLRDYLVEIQKEIFN